MRTFLAIFLLLASPAGAAAQQSIFGRNLIVNGGAEAGPSDPDGFNPVSSIPGWNVTGAPDVIQYASGYIIGVNNVVPMDGGASYFAGGRPAASSSLTQSIDLSSGAAAIDAGTATFVASGFFGGWESEPESAQMDLVFLDSAGRNLSSTSVGPVTNTDRENTIGLWYRRSIGQVPAGARSVRVTLQLNFASSRTNDATADNLSLVLNTPVSPQSLLERNIIVNGNAETLGVADPTRVDSSTIDVPGWNRTGLFTLDSYTNGSADLDLDSPGPDDRGSYYFYGGNGDAHSSAYQDIDVSSAASLVDAGNVTFQLSAWLGGFASQGDNAVLTVRFMNWSGASLGSVTLGPASADDRGDVSVLLRYSQSGGIPTGTRVIRVMLDMTRTDGGDNDGLADSLSLVLSSPGGGATPSIAPGSVVSASAFGGFSAVAPGAWIEIYGTNLAPDVRGWGAADFNGANAPTSLDGVKVVIGGQPAFVAYVSPTQVNAQVPSNVGTGQQTLVVSNAGRNSNPYPITINPTQAGLLAPSSFKIGGKQYVAAFLPDGSFALPQGAFAGVNSRPARPGEIVTLYGVGFGRVNPDIPAGQLVGGLNDLSLPFSMQFGGATAAVSYKGLAPNLVGVYQFNVTIPDVADNDALPLSFTLGGASGVQTLYVTVHR